MGSSTKKKNEKKKDFKKAKLKVGKAKAKAANFTYTSFKSKSIVLSQQSLSTSAPLANTAFSHHVSMLSHHSPHQRRDSLSYLTTMICTRPVDSPLPQPLSAFLPKLLPLILDQSDQVRSQLLALLQALPGEEISGHTERILLFVQSGMTHLGAAIRADSTKFLGWVLDVAGGEAVSTSSGWVKTTKCFLALLGWEGGVKTSGGVGKAVFGKAGAENKTIVGHLKVLGEFLTAGLLNQDGPLLSTDDIADNAAHYRFLSGKNLLLPHYTTLQHLLPKQSNCYAHLNIFVTVTSGDEISGMADDIESRRRLLQPYLAAVQRGLQNARQEGGEIGRAALSAQNMLENGMVSEENEEEDDR